MLTEPGDRGRVLDAAAHLLTDASPAMTAAIGAALRERESLGSTAIGHGVAIPHARSNAFSAARGAFLRLEHPVDFRSEARRVGKACVSTCSSRWEPYH